MQRYVLTIVSVALVAGCAIPQNQTPGAVATAPPPPLAAPAGGAPFAPGIAVAPPTTQVAPLPTGVILLTGADPNRNKWACQAFFGQLRPERELESAQPYSTNVIKVFWLDKRSSPPGPETLKRCDATVLDNYNYGRAQKIIDTLSPHPAGTGPFLVGYTGSANPKIMIDASKQPTQAAINAIVAAWVSSADSSLQPAPEVAERRNPNGLCTWAQKMVPKLLSSSSIIVNVVGLVGDLATSLGCPT